MTSEITARFGPMTTAISIERRWEPMDDIERKAAANARWLSRYEGAIIFPLRDESGEEGGSLLGEDAESVMAAEAAGVIYHCDDGGRCPHGPHTGGGFWHYMPGKGDADYDAATE